MNTQRVEGHTPIEMWVSEWCANNAHGESPSAQLEEAFRIMETMFANIERLEKVNEALVRAVEHAKSICAGNPEAYEIYCEAIRLAKEPA